MYGPYQAIIDSDTANVRDQGALMQALVQASQMQTAAQERDQSSQAFPLIQRGRELINQQREIGNKSLQLDYDLDTKFAAPTRQAALDGQSNKLAQTLPKHIELLAAMSPQMPSAARLSFVQDYIKQAGLDSFITLEETDPEAIPVKLAAIRDELNSGALKTYLEQLKQAGATDRALATNATRERVASARTGTGSGGRPPSAFTVLFNAKRAVQQLIMDGVPPNDPRYIQAYNDLVAAENAASVSKGPVARPGTPDLGGMGVPVNQPPSMLEGIPRPGATAAPTIPPRPSVPSEGITKKIGDKTYQRINGQWYEVTQ